MSAQDELIMIESKATSIKTAALAVAATAQDIVDAVDRAEADLGAAKLVGLKISPSYLMNVIPGSQHTLIATAIMSDNSEKVVTATYAVSAEGGSVSGNVYTAGTKEGVHTITATYGSETATVGVEVEDVAPIPPEPPPTSKILWEDVFKDGQLAPAKNGVGWIQGFQPYVAGNGDAVMLKSGALVFRYGGSDHMVRPPGITDVEWKYRQLIDDAMAEANGRLGELEAVFIGMTIRYKAYYHRNCFGVYPPTGEFKRLSPGNNKFLRCFGGAKGATRDQAYQQSQVKFGSSNIPYDPGQAGDLKKGFSKLIAEFGSSESGTGNFNTGPWTDTMTPTPGEIKMGFWAKVGTKILDTPLLGIDGKPHWSGIKAGDGEGFLWVNRKEVYHRTDLPMYTPGGFNRHQYWYSNGWWNSGTDATIELEMTHIVVALEPVASYIP